MKVHINWKDEHRHVWSTFFCSLEERWSVNCFCLASANVISPPWSMKQQITPYQWVCITNCWWFEDALCPGLPSLSGFRFMWGTLFASFHLSKSSISFWATAAKESFITWEISVVCMKIKITHRIVRSSAVSLLLCSWLRRDSFGGIMVNPSELWRGQRQKETLSH